MAISKISYCPNCGGDCRHISPEDGNNICPYCGYEIYDISNEKNIQRIGEVEKARKKVLSVPKLVALVVGITLLVMFVGTILFFTLHVNNAIDNYSVENYGSNYTRKMAKAYEKEDWDKLYDIVILDCEHSLESPYYFTYRSAWFLSVYPERFDEAYKKQDYETLNEVYRMIKEDYKMREQDLFGTIYLTIDEIEVRLEEEYERETKIMNELEDK